VQGEVILKIERRFVRGRVLVGRRGAALVRSALMAAWQQWPARVFAVQTLPRAVGLLVGGPIDLVGAFIEAFFARLFELASAVFGELSWRDASMEAIRPTDVSLSSVACVLATPVQRGLVSRVEDWLGFSTLDWTMAPLVGDTRSVGVPVSQLPAYEPWTGVDYAIELRRLIRRMEPAAAA